MPDNVDTYGIVSGYFNACFSLGAFLGPICGSAVMEATSFGYSATICAGLFLFSGLLIGLYIIFGKQGKTTEENADYSS
ncbi:hypothetical protein FSP39_002665 [Pinctada imbricata]|uniref:Major facilitator superfamily (MFS) profile domain-containing protein n=1 Tax=Pinctada imbricata TaxID=66713 RepID=A0AA88YBN2_PINIB|nr:hypothetical protein FSP39_002665 [Pinctada imbricata]